VPPLPTEPPRPAPAVAPVGPLTFPVLEHARLANGIPVTLARRGAVPTVEVNLSFDAGVAADFAERPGTQAMMLAMLDQGTAPEAHGGALGPTALLEAEERLGASIRAGAAMDSSAVTLSALSANLGPSLDLLADVVRHPAFAPADVARVRDQRLAALAQTLASPQGLALHRINGLLYGPGHPYAAAADGLGDAEAIRAQTSAALAAAHRRWLRPDTARITVVGDVSMAQLLPRLEAAFGDWQATGAPPPAKPIAQPGAPAKPRIVLLNRPNSPQSLILGGKLLGISGRQAGQEPLELANEVLGQDFLSRLNSDLREDKGWSYGVSSYVRQPLGERSLLVLAPVEAPRTGDAIKAILADMGALVGNRPVTAEELQRATDGNIRGLPNRYEGNAQVLDAITLDQRLGRPDDYTATLPARLAAVTAPALNAAARQFLRPEPLVFVVVGDAAVVGPQLKGLGLPVEMPDSTATH
jgi:predicted Zn-dependent peptidase